jgi:hypothetical protein
MYGSAVENVVGREDIVCGRERRLTVERRETIGKIMMYCFRDGASANWSKRYEGDEEGRMVNIFFLAPFRISNVIAAHFSIRLQSRHHRISQRL